MSLLEKRDIIMHPLFPEPFGFIDYMLKISLQVNSISGSPNGTAGAKGDYRREFLGYDVEITRICT